MSELFDTIYFRGQGPLFIASRDANGKPVGGEFVGDLESVTLTPQADRFEVTEQVTGAGAIGASGLNRVRYGLSIGFRSVKPSHLALILQGALTTNAAGSVSNEAHVAKLGKFSRLAHVKVSTVIVTGTGGTPTYVANTDYKVHADKGLIEWLAGGTITEDTATEIDYDYAANKVVTPNPQNVDKYLIFAGINTTNNSKQARVELYKAQLDPGALDLITDEPQPMTVGGILLLDTLRVGGDQLFRVIQED